MIQYYYHTDTVLFCLWMADLNHCDVSNVWAQKEVNEAHAYIIKPMSYEMITILVICEISVLHVTHVHMCRF